ncbi:hypothetical protein HPG69_006410, partial [Diceros bicornis minor]
PVPRPQILVWSLSVSEGWCNVTLECRAVHVTEDLNDLQTSPPAVSISLGNEYLKFSLNVNFLHSFCVRETDSHEQYIADPLQVILGATVAVLSILGAGLCLWKT